MAGFETWRKDWSLMGLFFTSQETERIQSRLESLSFDHLVYASFENRFARSGGLAAVTINTLPWLKEINGFRNAMLFSPFYPKIMSQAPLQNSGKTFAILFDQRLVEVEIWVFTAPFSQPSVGEVTEYYLRADGFFEAQNNLNDPYGYVQDQPEANDAAIRRNSLFFCKALPAALAALGITSNLIIHAQEWQTALLALAVKEAICDDRLHSCGVVHTIHNPFDSYFPSAELRQIVGEPRRTRIDSMLSQGATAWQIGLQLADGPITTVSENFSREFTTDLVHTGHFAPHLQAIFQRSGVFGINNGPFLPFSADFPKREHHTLNEIAALKKAKRRELLEVLDSYHPPQRFGSLTWQGGSIAKLPDKVPILVMSGRLDPGQKGYDLLLQAIERFALDELKVILTPLATKNSDLDYFYQVAGRYQGNLTVFPIRMQQGYQALQTGSSFGLMPSIYEPFGAAIEYMVNGTSVIARNTGGLADQITHDVNGVLFRERADHYTVNEIRAFAGASGIVQWRKTIPWVLDMVDALETAIRHAAELYSERPKAYYEMVRQGFRKAGHFSWEKNAEQYGRVYALVRK
jgi:glycogen synthase